MTGALQVAAVVAAAGRSTRMGTLKQLLPWCGSTVIMTVVHNLALAGAMPVVVVVGHEAGAVEEALTESAALIVHNADYARAEMLCSVQIGLTALRNEPCIGTLLALGDQPHIPVSVLRTVIDAAQETPDDIVLPSYNMRRGHPIYLPSSHWSEVLDLNVNDTLRAVLDRHAEHIRYVTVDTPSVLRDLDTPADYEALRPD